MRPPQYGNLVSEQVDSRHHSPAYPWALVPYFARRVEAF